MSAIHNTESSDDDADTVLNGHQLVRRRIDLSGVHDGRVVRKTNTDRVIGSVPLGSPAADEDRYTDALRRAFDPSGISTIRWFYTPNKQSATFRVDVDAAGVDLSHIASCLEKQFGRDAVSLQIRGYDTHAATQRNAFSVQAEFSSYRIRYNRVIRILWIAVGVMLVIAVGAIAGVTIRTSIRSD
jgi:hypothetical protein